MADDTKDPAGPPSAPAGKDVFPVQIEDEMRGSYIDYAMSVIVSRALPDVRDGLKPVHRRILYGMHDLGMTHSKPFKKCARIVGEVMGKYHPHGDSAIYDTLVRMAQDFSLRYPLVDGQGNFGSIDGDPAAAMRYTEARLDRLAEEMLADLEKETVTFQPNFDDSLQEPTVLPSKIPNLLVNGSDGIAVGMATKIPPHNLEEIVDALIRLIDNPATTLEELLQIVKGPDFPTGGYIVSSSELQKAYETGRGRLVVRAKTHVETPKTGRERIVVTEIPYQVNKSRLLEEIADLVHEKKVEGIADIRDESDRTGMRIVIELKRGENAELITNQLLNSTQLQISFGVNMVALVENRPLTLGLRRLCQEYIKHRREVVIRRTRFELERALERLHILEGLKKALENIDAVIALIKAAPTVEEARTGLMSRFDLSDRQARAILDMKLQRLTSLETSKLIEEYEATTKLVAELRKLLADVALIMGVVKSELLDVRARFGDGRRTSFIRDSGEFDPRDLIQKETKVISVSESGYIKSISEENYRRQHRGGKGLQGVGLKDEDRVGTILVAETFDRLLFFTNLGKVYSEEVWKLPEGERVSKGRPLVNLLNLEKTERVTAILPITAFEPGKYIFQATKKGLVKRTSLENYASCVRQNGIKAIKFETEDDELIAARLTDGGNSILLGTRNGQSIHFKESNVRPMGRVAQGVKGVTLAADDIVIGMEVVRDRACLLVVTERGYGKRSELEEYRIQGRGGQGIINIKVNPRNGNVAGFREVRDEDEIIVSTREGKFIRVVSSNVSKIGRNTQGVRIIDLGQDDVVIGVTVLRDIEQQQADKAAEAARAAAAPPAPVEAADDEPEDDGEGPVN